MTRALTASARAGTPRLSREQVAERYGPWPDPAWTPEVEAAFFARLPSASHRDRDKPNPAKAGIIREFATSTLKAQRMSGGYIAALGAVLGRFAAADLDRTECLVSQRDSELGTPRTVRTIQVQMVPPGLLVKVTRTQGHGFTGDVYVYRPRAAKVCRRPALEALEGLYRADEGEAPCRSDRCGIEPGYVCF